MSGTNNEDPKVQDLADNAAEKQVGGDISVEELNSSDKSDENPVPASDKNNDNSMPSPQQQVYSVSALHTITLFDLVCRNQRTL